MVDRLRAFLEEPLDPRTGRAVLVFASAILLGFAALFILAASEPDEPNRRSELPRTAVAAPSSPPAAAPEPAVPDAGHPAHRQDPQDEEGSVAARRADRALRSHRALQHVPYRDEELTVELVGARGPRAVLRVSAETVRAARRGWDRFLRRYRDGGDAYLPLFKVRSEAPHG